MSSSPVLIAGAGPAGLAAALFLAGRGVRSRVIDASPTPTATSKALGVNPRTLDLLEPTGVTARIMAEGLPMTWVRLHRRGKPLTRIRLPLERLGARFPMVILPQARTEALLTEALAAHGVTVERGVALEALAQNADTVSVTLRRPDGAAEETSADLLFAADGAHSTARHQLGVGFPGSKFPEPWDLIDVDLEGPEPNGAWVDFQKPGVFVALPFNETVWRLIGFGGDLLARLPQGWKAGPSTGARTSTSPTAWPAP